MNRISGLNSADTMTESDSTGPSGTTMECKNCARRIIKEAAVYVVCNGPCNSSFHITCVGVSKDQQRSLARGVLWLCNGCLSRFDDWKKSAQNSPPFDASSVQQDVSELKNHVSRIMQALDLSSKQSSPSDVVFRHSTPVKTAALMNGSNVSYDSASGIQCDHVEQNVDREMEDTSENNRSFSLLLTNIDNTVSESDIKVMVCGCLGAPTADCESVIKLVPRRMDCTSFDYISFKVVLKSRWKLRAMSATTWPTAVKFREFLSRQNQTWKPRYT